MLFYFAGNLFDSVVIYQNTQLGFVDYRCPNLNRSEWWKFAVGAGAEQQWKSGGKASRSTEDMKNLKRLEQLFVWSTRI